MLVPGTHKETKEGSLRNIASSMDVYKPKPCFNK